MAAEPVAELGLVKWTDEDNGLGQGPGHDANAKPPDAPTARGNFQTKCEVKSCKIMVMLNPSKSGTQDSGLHGVI